LKRRNPAGNVSDAVDGLLVYGLLKDNRHLIHCYDPLFTVAKLQNSR
jgi:hypothetical protein